MRRIVLDCTPVSQRSALHAALAKALQLPDYYGSNLDALHDCLTDIAAETQLVLTHTDALPSHVLHGLERVFADSSAENPAFQFALWPQSAPAAERLAVLGTGNAMVTEYYNTCFALAQGNEYLLVDAGGGNGILRQLKAAKIPASAIRHLIVTHEHCDHLLGVVWVLRRIATDMKAGSYTGNFHVWCHAALCQTIHTIAQLTLQKKFVDLIGERILLHPISDGDCADLLGWQVQFFDIHSTKALQYGFWLTLADGRKLTCLGDEPYNPACAGYVQGSDVLLCEAFCLYSQREAFSPYEKHHSTVKEACELATNLGVSTLVLWHTEDKTAGTRKARYTAEGSVFFSGQLLVPDDLEVISLAECSD